MKASTKYIGTLALAVTLTVASLTGCVAQAPTAGPKPTHSSTAVATPKPTTAPVVATPLIGDLDGNGIVDGWEKEQLAKSTYTLPDGSEVAIPTDRPLPAVVIAAVSAAAAPAAVAYGRSSGTAMEKAGAALGATIAGQEAKIGRTIVPVTKLPSGQWGVGNPAPTARFGSEAAAVANANSYVGSSTSMVVVVFS